VVTDRLTKRPDAARAAQLKAALRARGVLVGIAGPHGNILKAR
jgi:4-aminobutyrate aminotransferase-like enzyme